MTSLHPKSAYILVVEDDKTSAFIIETCLQKAGYKNIHHALTGADAINFAQMYDYDLILLDLMLPDTNGYELCTEFKSWEKYKEVPISMVTSMDSHDEKIKALKLGVEDFIHKPLYEEEFIIKVNRQIERRYTLERTRSEKHELNTLRNILSINYSDLSLEEIFERITEEITDLLNSDRTTIFLKKGKYLISKNAQGMDQNPFIITIDQGIAGSVARTGHEQISNDVQQEIEFNSDVDKKTGYLTKRMITYPIFHEYKVIGVIQTLNKPSDYTENDLEKLKKVSMYTANILARYYAEKQIKRSERFYRNLLDRLYNGVFIVDDNHKIIYVNQAFTEIFGYSRRDIIGKNKKILFVSSDQIYLDELGPNIINIETHLLTKNHDLCPIKLSTKRFELDELTSGTIYNVSDLRTSLELEKKEIELDRMRSEFNSMIIHDLKNPLTGVSGFAELLMSEEFGHLNNKQKSYVDKIMNSSERMLKLTTEMLEISKMESGNVPLNLKDIDLVSVVHNVVEAQAIFFKKRNIQFFDQGDDIPMIEADYDKIYRLFTNLISNALKFTPISGQIIVEYKRSPHFIQIEVRDTGVGIPDDDIDFIFDMYKQSANNKKGMGTGIGLAICKFIAEAHKGIISVKSVLGHGTSFFVKLPVSFNESSSSISRSETKEFAKI